MLIKLMGVPHPDMNGGQPQPVYVDASRVLLIVQGWQQHPKIGMVERRQGLVTRVWEGACKLADAVGDYIPNMHDPASLEWSMKVKGISGEVNEAYRCLSQYRPHDDYHPKVDCTEVQLACGTALEHGVMLTRVWVSNPIEEVARLIEEARTS